MIGEPRMLPDLDTIPAARWATRLVLGWFRHLHNSTAYRALGLHEFRYVDGTLVPAEDAGDGSLRISGDAFPVHAVRIVDGDTLTSWGGTSADSGDAAARDEIEIVGAVYTKVDQEISCGPVEEIIRVLEFCAQEAEQKRDLEALLGGEARFRIRGGPQARREGPAGSPTQWGWGYVLRLYGPFRQLTA